MYIITNKHPVLVVYSTNYAVVSFNVINKSLKVESMVHILLYKTRFNTTKNLLKL